MSSSRSGQASDPGPLAGLTVVDMATMMAAPWAATFLADFGADVIKVEHPAHGDHARGFGLAKEGEPVFWKSIGRNKRSMTLDLKDPAGREVFLRLASRADVIIENFRPGTLARLGLGFDVLERVNERLILLSVTGYGQTGPYAARPGFGTLIEALCGFAYSNGQPDGPPTLPAIPLADGVAGVFGALSVLMAVYERDLNGSGRGQHIDLSLFEPLARLMEGHVLEYSVLGVIRERLGNASLSSAPRNAYRAGDGRWLAVSASAQPVFERLMAAIGRPELSADPRFASNDARIRNRETLDEVLSTWIAGRTRDEAIEFLSACGAAAGPVYDIAEFMADEHVVQRGTFETHQDPVLGPVTLPAVVAKFSRTPGGIRHLGQPQGAATDEVLGELGYSAADIERLRAAGTV